MAMPMTTGCRWQDHQSALRASEPVPEGGFVHAPGQVRDAGPPDSRVVNGHGVERMPQLKQILVHDLEGRDVSQASARVFWARLLGLVLVRLSVVLNEVLVVPSGKGLDARELYLFQHLLGLGDLAKHIPALVQPCRAGQLGGSDHVEREHGVGQDVLLTWGLTIFGVRVPSWGPYDKGGSYFFGGSLFGGVPLSS